MISIFENSVYVYVFSKASIIKNLAQERCSVNVLVLSERIPDAQTTCIRILLEKRKSLEAYRSFLELHCSTWQPHVAMELLTSG